MNRLRASALAIVLLAACGKEHPNSVEPPAFRYPTLALMNAAVHSWTLTFVITDAHGPIIWPAGSIASGTSGCLEVPVSTAPAALVASSPAETLTTIARQWRDTVGLDWRWNLLDSVDSLQRATGPCANPRPRLP